MEKVSFYFNLEVCRHAMLYILNQLNNRCDLHKLFKILYFAEQKHLANYGMPITGDCYIAMKNGPVPSAIYNFFKQLREEKKSDEDFRIEENYWVSTQSIANLKKIAKSKQEMIEEAIQENKSLNFGELTKKSHGLAWSDADENDEIDFIKMAKEAGADELIEEFITINSENAQYFH
jgi:uncharacterized phage-associated protein